MSSEPLVDLGQQQQVAANVRLQSPSGRPRTPIALKVDTTVTILPGSSVAYTPYSSFRSSTGDDGDADLPTPTSVKARQCLAIFHTLCLFGTAYPFRPGILSQAVDSYDVSCYHLKAVALGLDWFFLNWMLVSSGYIHFCLASLEEAISFRIGRRRRIEVSDLEKMGPQERRKGLEMTWWPGYFWVLAIGEILLLESAVVSGDQMLRMGAVGMVVVFGWVLGWKAARPLGVKL
ncbi:hypothetical protein QBC38DRAFT_474700 [Podospora fimiseda]|uniref:Uncharacterized protein n=1 Tax=Podospora fimiseda TaxID=252190 RepID=A0AAN7BRW5_9PEZI|nr:hypothetical protein QBC38DRAFT_474700 [Podospora fimiseda]